MTKTNFTSLTLLLLLGFIWGTGYSIARFATTHDVSPLGYSFWQSLGPAILIGLLSLKNIKAKSLTLEPRKRSKHLRYYLICGLTGIVIPNTNMYFAAPHLPAGILAVIVNTVPIIAYPLALLARAESFGLMRFCGVLFAVVGLMLIILPRASLPSPDMIPWVLSALLTPISFAFCAIYIDRYRPKSGNSLSMAAGTLIASSLLLLPFVCISNNFYHFHLPLTIPDWVILLEIILSSMGYVLLFKLIKLAGPVYYSLVDTIVSLTGLFWGYIIFQEQLNPWSMSAIFFILTALLLVTQKPSIQLIKST